MKPTLYILRELLIAVYLVACAICVTLPLLLILKLMPDKPRPAGDNDSGIHSDWENECASNDKALEMLGLILVALLILAAVVEGLPE